MQDGSIPPGSPDGTPADFLNFRAVLQARAAAQQHGLHHSQRHLLEVIAGYTNGHPAWPSYDVLAGITGLSASRVRQYSYALVSAGYLALTRRPSGSAGWGQPQWSLGPLCGVSKDGHSTPDEVSTNGTVKRPPVDTPSVQRRTQKRDSSVDPGGPAVHGNGRGKSKEGGEEKNEERTSAKALTPKQQRVADVCEAIKAQGGEPPRISGRDAGAINASNAPAEEIATAWLRLIRGEWPPESASLRDKAFAQNNRVMWFAVDRLTTILTPPANGATNGRTLRGVEALRAMRAARSSQT